MDNISPPSTDPFNDALEIAARAASSYLKALDQTPVGATTGLRVLREQLSRPFPEAGLAPEQVIEELVADVSGGLLGSAGGRFFGWVVGGSLPAALAADWLTATWDQNAALAACSPAAGVAEEIAGSWLKTILGLPPGASFAFVSGCQMAHLTCLAAARHALLAKQGWDAETQGLHGAPRLRILANRESHASVERAVRLLGFGSSSIENLPGDGAGSVSPDGLQQALERDPASPAIVILQAGEINTGACDPFDALVPIAKSHGAWVHVDGAFGLWAAASPRYRQLVRGVDLADSWATDGHKWLNVPYDCGYAFVNDPAAHRAAMTCRAAYVTFDDEARDAMDWNPEWSRRARGFPTYAALRQLGRDGVSDLIDRCCAHARSLVSGIGALEGARVVSLPTLNQGTVQFLDPKPGAGEDDHARRTDAVIAAVNAGGEAFFTGSNWQGRRVMRVSVCNWRTNETDVERVVAAVEKVLRKT